MAICSPPTALSSTVFHISNRHQLRVRRALQGRGRVEASGAWRGGPGPGGGQGHGGDNRAGRQAGGQADPLAPKTHYCSSRVTTTTTTTTVVAAINKLRVQNTVGAPI